MFGFPKIEHKNYNKNFLKTVIFQIAYDEKNIIERKKNITDLFGPILPRINDKVTKGVQISFKNDQTPILQSLDDGNIGMAIEMRSNDGQKILTINNFLLSYTVSGKSYTNFENLKNELSLIDEFYNILHISTLNRLAIRKINIIEFKISNSPSEILAHLISPELLSNLYYFPKPDSIIQNIHSISFQDGSYRLNLKYGLNVPQLPASDLGQIILDIDLFNISKIESSKTFSFAGDINSEIFNIFNWALSENTIKLLNE